MFITYSQSVTFLLFYGGASTAEVIYHRMGWENDNE